MAPALPAAPARASSLREMPANPPRAAPAPHLPGRGCAAPRLPRGGGSPLRARARGSPASALLSGRPSPSPARFWGSARKPRRRLRCLGGRRRDPRWSRGSLLRGKRRGEGKAVRGRGGDCLVGVVVGTEGSVRRREQSCPVHSQVRFQAWATQRGVLLPTALQRRSRASAPAAAARDGACSDLFLPP